MRNSRPHNPTPAQEMKIHIGMMRAALGMEKIKSWSGVNVRAMYEELTEECQERVTRHGE